MEKVTNIELKKDQYQIDNAKRNKNDSRYQYLESLLKFSCHIIIYSMVDIPLRIECVISSL